MNNTKILLTSFQTWLPHHTSNSSDDLLAQVENLDFSNKELIFLRKLPVHIKKATKLTIAKIKQTQPDLVICCGMAEKRTYLQLETQAFYQDQSYQTKLNLTALTQNLAITKISDDAGKFVCEGLYFHILQYVANKSTMNSLFIHVPLLTPSQHSFILGDFLEIIRRL